ncbi:MAG: ABC-type amino acid transport substrate-binding protein [Pseudohongiellaceae bacterium]
MKTAFFTRIGLSWSLYMNGIFKSLTGCLHITLFLSIFPNATFAEKILIRAESDAYPATYIETESWEGMDIDIISEIFLRAKLDYYIINMPFKRSLIQIKEGKIHLIPNLTKNKERSVYMNWLGPIRITCIGLVVQKKDQVVSIKTTNDLIKVAHQENKKVGYLTGSSFSEIFDYRLKSDSNLQEILSFLPDKNQHLEMLKLGRIFGYFHDGFEIQKRFLDQNYAQQYSGLALHSYQIEDSCSGAYIGISRKLDKTNYMKIKTSFDAMKDDETFSKIHLKWIGTKPLFEY